MDIRHTTLGLLALSLGFASCSKDSDDATVQLRPKMDYATLTATTPYTTSFKDASGGVTVEIAEPNQRLAMFSELNTYMAGVALATNPTTLDAAKLRGLYANTGNYFADATLNASGLQLRGKTAESFGPNAEAIRTYIDQKITKLAAISASVNNTATAGNPGRLGRYLVDENGIEVNQVIQKGLIGSLLLDQIDNVLLSEAALKADNTKLVDGKLYTALEHNWDLAYGTLTKNPVLTLTQNYTPTLKEIFLAGYLNEKNGANSPRVYLAFLKGRAAIINNDRATLTAQADIIRTELEKTIALSATSYLASWKNGTDLDAKAHALGEGIGFIYSLRFCNSKYKADAAFSDAQLNTLLPGTQANGAWSLTNAQADAVIAAISTKFAL